MTTTACRWAVIGTGAIARRFVGDMRYARRGVVTAIASRSPERARELAGALGTTVAHGETADVLARDDIDAVYVATPNATHAELALAALAAGKPVLVEKPLATAPDDAARIADAAGAAGLLAMEAMWMRATPGVVRLKRLLDDGAIGEVRSIRADMSFAHHYEPHAALFDPAHGGALVDLGVYPLSLAQHVAGDADAISGAVRHFANGAVAAASFTTRHGDILASLSCSFASEGSNEAVVEGTRGWVKLHGPFFCPPFLSLRRMRDAGRGETGPAPALAKPPAVSRLPALRQMLSPVRTRRLPVAFKGTGLQYQADHFAQCLARGLAESPLMPLRQSVDAIRLLRQLR